MNRTLVCLMLLLLLASLPLQSVSEGQQVTSSLTIYMGDVVKSDMVAGIIHNVTIVLSQPSDDVVLKAHLASSFTTGNKTNNYSWSYSGGVWNDDLYLGYYIKNESARYGNAYCFHIAVDSKAAAGNWRFVTIADGAEVSNRPVNVRTPVAGISMSAPTFYFNIIPYGTGYISSWKPDNATNSEFLTTENIGNVPLTISMKFESMASFGTSYSFSATNSTGTFIPGESRRHYVDFQAQKWSPRKFTVKGYISGEPQLLLTPDTVSTIIAPRTTFDVVVTVARPGYDVFQIDGVSVQYKSLYYSAYKKSMSLDMYLTGNKSVYMGQEMMNLSFNHFLYQNAESKTELLLSLSDEEGGEQHVVANITCSSAPAWKKPSMITYANFTFRLEDNTDSGKLTSTVIVKSTSGTDSGNQLPISANLMVILIIVVIFVIIGAALFKVYRKTEEERRRELEDRIRKRKEKAKKQRRN